MSNRGGSAAGIKYWGTLAQQPPNITFENRPPEPSDVVNYSVGDFWLDQSASPEPELWFLASQKGDTNSRGEIAHWVRLSGATGTVVTLAGNDGILVPADNNGNINVVGDPVVGINVTGDILTQTLTITSSSGSPFCEFITGNDGIPVPADNNGNINVVGNNAVGLDVTGDIATNTLTVTTLSGSPVGEFISGDNGGPVPFSAAGNISIVSENATNGAGSTVLFTPAVAPNTIDLVVTDGAQNTLVGRLAGNLAITTGGLNTSLGYLSAASITSGSSNTMIGRVSGTLLTTGSRNSAVGNGSLTTIAVANDNTAVGYSALALTTRSRSTAVGSFALANYTTDGGTAAQTAIGHFALNSVTTAVGSVAVGEFALLSHTTGPGRNTAIGNFSQAAATTASLNTSLGDGSLILLETGEKNLCLGYNAGINYTTNESFNILLNHDGVVGENNTTRIGGSGVTNRAFMGGVYGVTPPGAGLRYVVQDNAGQLGTTVVAPGAGGIFNAYLAAPVVNATGSGTYYQLICTVEIADTSGNYNNATGVYTADATGYYAFQMSCEVANLTSAMVGMLIGFTVTGTSLSVGNWVTGRSNPYQTGATSRTCMSGSITIPMDAGDTIVAWVIVAGGLGNSATVTAVEIGIVASPTYFSGSRLA